VAELTVGERAPVSAQVVRGAREALAEVSLILGGGPFREPPAELEEPGVPESASVFLGQLMFALNLANGRDPRDHELLEGENRGQKLARAFMSRATVEVCCDYCGGLMVQAIANAIAAMMRQIHGNDAAPAWDGFMKAIIPRQQPPEIHHEEKAGK
jgi:hypothetical protein